MNILDSIHIAWPSTWKKPSLNDKVIISIMRLFSGRQHQQPCRYGYTLVQIAWKKPHDIITLSFSEGFFQVEGQANSRQIWWSEFLFQTVLFPWTQNELEYLIQLSEVRSAFIFSRQTLNIKTSRHCHDGGSIFYVSAA